MYKFKGSLCHAVKLFLKSLVKVRPDGDENRSKNLSLQGAKISLYRKRKSLSTGSENLSPQVWRSKTSALLCKVQGIFPHLNSCLSGQSRAGFLNL